VAYFKELFQYIRLVETSKTTKIKIASPTVGHTVNFQSLLDHKHLKCYFAIVTEFDLWKTKFTFENMNSKTNIKWHTGNQLNITKEKKEASCCDTYEHSECSLSKYP
jgi:hypothetical protein